MPIQLAIIGVQSVRAARARVTSMKTAFALAPRSLIHDAAVVLRAALKRHAPSRTGQLRASIGFRVTATAAGGAARFHAAQQAIFVIGGTRAHEIWAGIYTGKSNKKALFWPGAGHPTPYVQHPGTKPNDFRRPAWDEAKPEVMGILRQTGRGIFSGQVVGAPVEL